MTDPIWITTPGFLYLHEETLAFHGGKSGLRDLGLLESAISRAQNIFVYQGINDPARLAAAYAFGIARNHPFFDGNKRAAFAAIGLFLGKNGFRFTAQQNDDHAGANCARGRNTKRRRAREVDPATFGGVMNKKTAEKTDTK